MLFNTNQHFDHVITERQAEFIDPGFILRCAPQTIKILIVVDGSISFGNAGFGLGNVISTLQTPKYSYVRFEVSTATREASGGSPAPDFTGFRFDQTESDGSPTINNFDQIWMFGIHPNSTFNESAFTDGDIDDAGNNPLSEPELATLTHFMNEREGGVFATGDHYILGASMCSQIPRVGTMRKWTIAQGAPSVSSAATRHSTLRPASAGQTALTSGLQSDDVPQPLELKRYSLRPSFVERSRSEPHPLMCDPEHGAINVFPDHQHEGCIIEDGDVEVDEQYDFGNDVVGNNVAGDEYPTVGSDKPVPEVIAWANTLGSPTYTHGGTSIAPKRFGVIGVYDGSPANVGRVVVDSTWHHWFNTNLVGLAADSSTNHYEKIQTHYRNIGIWLATPNQRSAMLRAATWNAAFTVDATQNWNLSVSNYLLGEAGRDVIGREVSSCLMREFIYLDLTIPEKLFPIPELDPLCLSCPPEDFIIDSVLGGIIREMLPVQQDMMREKLNGKAVAVEDDKLLAMAKEGSLKGAESFAKDFEISANAAMKQFENVGNILRQLR